MQIAVQKRVAVESLVIDGENEENVMAGCDAGEAGFHAPFALFSPDLQHNVGGPYASREHAAAALEAVKQGQMVPYIDRGDVVWTINGKPSPWYEKE